MGGDDRRFQGRDPVIGVLAIERALWIRTHVWWKALLLPISRTKHAHTGSMSANSL